MRVVNPRDPEFLTLSFDRGHLVQQHWKTGSFQRRHHFHKIVISKNPPSERAKRLQHLRRLAEAEPVVAVGLISVIPGDDCRVMRHFCGNPLHDVR